MSINRKSSALVIFAREPKQGKVKTRLSKNLSSYNVLDLYKAFIKDVLHIASQVKCEQRFIFYSGHGAQLPFLNKYKRKFLLRRQTGEDLGVRMFRAIKRCHEDRFNKTIIIGTDCLSLTPGEIDIAFKKLDEHDCVIGPSKDGGYYLIGMREPNNAFFNGIKWSTSSVLKETLKRLRRLNKKVYLLQKHEDIDTIDHLRKLTKSIVRQDNNFYTKKVLKQLSIQ